MLADYVSQSSASHCGQGHLAKCLVPDCMGFLQQCNRSCWFLFRHRFPKGEKHSPNPIAVGNQIPLEDAFPLDGSLVSPCPSVLCSTTHTVCEGDLWGVHSPVFPSMPAIQLLCYVWSTEVVTGWGTRFSVSGGPRPLSQDKGFSFPPETEKPFKETSRCKPTEKYQWARCFIKRLSDVVLHDNGLIISTKKDPPKWV